MVLTQEQGILCFCLHRERLILVAGGEIWDPGMKEQAWRFHKLGSCAKQRHSSPLLCSFSWVPTGSAALLPVMDVFLQAHPGHAFTLGKQSQLGNIRAGEWVGVVPVSFCRTQLFPAELTKEQSTLLQP